jgi:RNA-binding motif X-linked protein 2
MLSKTAKIKQIQNLNEEELKHNIPYSASWHSKYKNSAYIYISNFPYELTEGDLVIIFSQYGEIVDCRIVRDSKTGKSKGFGYICYEDQRSTILAIDNLNGSNICNRMLLVDHIEQYKIPKEYFEYDENNEYNNKIFKPTGPDGKGWGEFRELNEEDKKYFEKLEIEEKEREIKNKKIFMDNDLLLDKNDDNEWEKKYIEIINNKKNEINEDYNEIYLLKKKTYKKKKKQHQHHHHHHHKHKNKK